MNKLLFLMFLLLVCCKEKQESPDRTDTGSFSRQLDLRTNRRVNLTPEAREQVSQWLAYATAQNEMQGLRTSTGEEILGAANSISQIMESLHTTIPDTLETPAVSARTNVLLTKAKLLLQRSRKKEKNPDEIYDLANDLVEAFDNFKLQLNEVFLEAPNDFEAALDQEFKEATARDTSYKQQPGNKSFNPSS